MPWREIVITNVDRIVFGMLFWLFMRLFRLGVRYYGGGCLGWIGLQIARKSQDVGADSKDDIRRSHLDALQLLLV